MCPNCGAADVRCWVYKRERLHASYNPGRNGAVYVQPYDSIFDEREDGLEVNEKGEVKLDCVGCLHEWSEPMPEEWLYD